MFHDASLAVLEGLENLTAWLRFGDGDFAHFLQAGSGSAEAGRPKTRSNNQLKAKV